MAYNVLLIGSGGREHALAWGLSKSKNTGRLYAAPGNPGTAALGENVVLNPADFDEILAFIREKDIHVTIVGPELPLVNGIADFLEGHGCRVFGPKQQAAMLEGSKEYAKDFMSRHHIPTAAYRVFDRSEFDKAAEYIIKKNSYPIVLKADGLAGGKGVLIPETEKEALEALETLQSGNLSSAASRLVIEEFMEGEEASVFAVSDGSNYQIIGCAQDHKRIGDGDTGLNTGGMGAYAPAPLITPDLLERIETEIIKPTISGMKAEGTPYTGVLYAGLMITAEGPKVVEYNCRFGDPECQVLVPLLKTDLLDIILAATDGSMADLRVEFESGYHCCVVMVSGGYPGAYQKNKEITGLEKVKEALIFHAGTKTENGRLLTNGGRVLNVTAGGATLKEALDTVYREIKNVRFEQAYYRKDIGVKGLVRIS